MKIICVFIVFATLCSCQVNKGLDRIKYNPHGKDYQLSLTIPKGYSKDIITGGETYEYRYKYNDSSVIYITEESNGGLNYENIRGQKDSYSMLFQAMDSNMNLTLEGIDSNNLYWKHESLGNYSIGYLKVSKDKKVIFDKAMESATKR